MMFSAGLCAHGGDGSQQIQISTYRGFLDSFGV